MPEPAVSHNQNDVVVAGRFQVLPGELQGDRVDLNGYHEAPFPYDLPGQGCAIARPKAYLKKLVSLVQTKGFIEERIAVRARYRRPCSRERQGHLVVGVVPIQ